MNQTGSKAIEEITSFELVYRKKLDLRLLKKWEDEVLIHQAGRQSKGWIGHNNKNIVF